MIKNGFTLWFTDKNQADRCAGDFFGSRIVNDDCLWKVIVEDDDLYDDIGFYDGILDKYEPIYEDSNLQERKD